MVVALILIASKSGGVILERWTRRDGAQKLLSSTSPLLQKGQALKKKRENSAAGTFNGAAAENDSGAKEYNNDEETSLLIQQRGEVISWMHTSAKSFISEGVKDEEEIVMRKNGVPIVFVTVGEIVFYFVGSEEVDEMQCMI